LLLLLIVAVYGPLRQGIFNWDDGVHFLNNPYMQTSAGLREIWLHPRHVDYPLDYFPVTSTVFWLEYHLWGADDAGGYHLVSIAIHAVNTLLLWALLRRWAVPWAWLAAAIFALHPMQVETVAWISEQKNLLSGLFYLLALGSYGKYLDPPARPGRRALWYALAMGLLTLAMLSKVAAVSFPVVVGLLLYWRHGRVTRRDAVRLIPAVLIVLVGAAIYMWSDVNMYSAEDMPVLTPVGRILVAGRALGFYVGKFLWPDPLLIIYPRWLVGVAWWEYLFPLAVAGVLVVLGLWARHRSRGPLVAVLFFIVTLSPVLGFVNFSYFTFSFVADHFTYLANIGLIVLLVQVLRLGSGYAGRWPPLGTLFHGLLAPPVLAALGVVPMLAVLTWGQVQLYVNPTALWRYTVDHNPQAWMAHAMLAGLYLDTGRLDEGFAEAKTSMNMKYNRYAHRFEGLALWRQGRLGEAAAVFGNLIRRNPGERGASFSLGEVLLEDKKYAAAAAALTAALQRFPDADTGWNNLAVCYLKLEDWPHAATAAQMALQRWPDAFYAHYNLAAALEKMGQRSAAREHYKRAVELNPGYAPARAHWERLMAADGPGGAGRGPASRP